MNHDLVKSLFRGSTLRQKGFCDPPLIASAAPEPTEMRYLLTIEAVSNLRVSREIPRNSSSPLEIFRKTSFHPEMWCPLLEVNAQRSPSNHSTLRTGEVQQDSECPSLLESLELTF